MSAAETRVIAALALDELDLARRVQALTPEQRAALFDLLTALEAIAAQDAEEATS